MFNKNLVQSSLQSVLGVKKSRLDFHLPGYVSGIFNFILDSSCMMTVDGLINQIFEELDIFTSGANKKGLDTPIKVLSLSFGFLCIFLDFLVNLFHVPSSGSIFLWIVMTDLYFLCKALRKKVKG